jgi:transcriptional regulator
VRRIKLKPEDVQRILQMRENGIKVDEIARAFGVSPRRIWQILKSKKISRPGRKKVLVPENVKREILCLRSKGYSISKITTELQMRGFQITRYLVWRVIREEYEKFIVKRACGQIKNMFHEYDKILGLQIIPFNLNSSERRKYKLVFLIDCRRCSVVSWKVYYSLRLVYIITMIDEVIHNHRMDKIFLCLPRRPPLAPTRDCDNRLTKHLKNLNIEYMWLPRELVKTYKRYIKLMTNMLDQFSTMEEVVEWMSCEGVSFIEKACKKLVSELKKEVLGYETS